MSGIAYVDESEPDQRADPGVYLLAAAVVADDATHDTRSVMRRLLRPGRTKVRWNREPDRHQELARAVADTGGTHLVVVRTGDLSGSERRRRLCLERLLYELQALDVAEAVLEARETRQNARDMEMLSALRARKVIGGELHMYHVPGPDEPLLWMPDIVAGAYGADRRGDHRHLKVLGDLVTVHTC